MKFYGKAESAAKQIVAAFESGNLPAALAPIFIRRKDDRPSTQWSWGNQLIAGCLAARMLGPLASGLTLRRRTQGRAREGHHSGPLHVQDNRSWRDGESASTSLSTVFVACQCLTCHKRMGNRCRQESTPRLPIGWQTCRYVRLPKAGAVDRCH